MAQERTVRFRYTSNKNISFTGIVDSGVPWSDWHRLDEGSKAEVEHDSLNKIVDLVLIEDEDPGEFEEDDDDEQD